MVALRLILLFAALYATYRAAKSRAPIEAKAIKASSVELGFKWHVKMWLTGKAGAVLFYVPFLLTFSGWYILYAAIPSFIAAMALYSYVFDQAINLSRNYPRWYISFDDKTAQTDKVLREIMWRFKLTPKQTHLYVKLPLITLGLIACVLVAFR